MENLYSRKVRYFVMTFLLLFSFLMAENQEEMHLRNVVPVDSPDEENAWEFHTSGDIDYSWLHYQKKHVITSKESGSEVYGTLNVSADYDTRDWTHSFGFNVSGDWFLDKEDMPSLDTNSWEASLGVEYTLIGKTLFLDFGANMNTSESETWDPDFFIWAEKYFVCFGRQKVGIASWAFEDLDGLSSLALYASWHRNAVYGWSGSVYAGGRFETDSIAVPKYWLQWMGPSLKSRITYKFSNDISLEARGNLFYGFIVDGPYANYEKSKSYRETGTLKPHGSQEFWAFT